jgi:hypothetical protein
MLNSVTVKLGHNGLYSVEARSDTAPFVMYADLSYDDIIPNLVGLGMPEQSALDFIAQCQNHSHGLHAPNRASVEITFGRETCLAVPIHGVFLP